MDDTSQSANPAFETIRWDAEAGRIVILDQTLLPQREVYKSLSEIGHVWQAIKQLQVRGAPAIGIAGAYALAMGIRQLHQRPVRGVMHHVDEMANYLISSRPTAVNLQWAVDRVRKTAFALREEPIAVIAERTLAAARAIHEEDRMLCKAIGEHGAALVPEGGRLLTHCNTGGLATAQYGTAMSVIWHAHRAGRLRKVWVDETRPLLQGARLTTWELQKYGIPGTLIIDSAGATLMRLGEVDLVVVGADRIAANGDTANKIGTYPLAVLCRHHGIPFYVAAPYSTFDALTPDGSHIEIELRAGTEITEPAGHRVAPAGTDTWNPAFDVTPADLIDGFITEKGILRPPYSESLRNAPSPPARG